MSDDHLGLNLSPPFRFTSYSVWNEIITNCVELASSNAQDIRRQLDFAKVSYVEGLAAFPDSGGTDTLSVELPDSSVEIVRADKFLIATGSKPFRPGGIPFDGRRIFDSDSINQVGCRFNRSDEVREQAQRCFTSDKLPSKICGNYSVGYHCH